MLAAVLTVVIAYAVLYFFNVVARVDRKFKLSNGAKVEAVREELLESLQKLNEAEGVETEERSGAANESREYRRLKHLVLANRWSGDNSYLLQLVKEEKVENDPRLRDLAFTLINLSE